MSTYLTIFYASIRPEIQEKISIGLLLMNDTHLYLGFSKEKIALTKQLFPTSVYKGLKNAIANIQKEALKGKFEKIKNQHFISAKKVETSLFNEKYLTYLSKYNSNIFTYSKPEKIKIKLNQNNFNILFSKFIAKPHPPSLHKKENNFISFKKQLKSNLNNYYNIDYEFSEKEIPNLIIPIRLDIAGKNKFEVFGKSINFERGSYHIKNDLGNLSFLQNTTPKSKRFIISQEPNKTTFAKQHLIWQHIKASDWFEYVDINEVERIEDYAKKHDVRPLFQTISSKK